MKGQHERELKLKELAAFIMMLAPGAALAFYVAMVGFYVKHFESRPFFTVMMIALYTPCPLISILQERYDEGFDEQFTPRVTFFFRVVWMQVVLAAVILGWMLLPQTPVAVLSIGVVLGVVYGTVVSSSAQLTSTMDPTYTNYLFLGQQIGGLLPLLLLFAFSFRPSAPLQQFRWVLAPVLLVCTCTVSVLFYFHFSLGIFDKAFRRLSYSLSQNLDDVNCDFDPQLTETQPLSPKGAYEGVPRWVWWWCGSKACTAGTTALLLALTSFLGSAELAQSLSVSKFAVDFAGSLAAIPLRDLPSFEDGAWHGVLIGSLFAYTCTGLVLIAKLVEVAVPEPALLLSWSALHGICNFTHAHIDVTTSAYVAVAERKAVSRRSVLATTTCGALGLVAALAILFVSGSIHGEWPAMNMAIV